MKLPLWWVLLALLSLTGCGSEWTAIPGTTTRIGKPTPKSGTELDLRFFTGPDDCLGVGIAGPELEPCLPYVDRANGEVRIAFRFELKGQVYPLPLDQDELDHIQVLHLGTRVRNGEGGQSIKLIPHDPQPVRQLFVLVIDGSSSMLDDNRMKKVKQALLMPEVQEAFFPEDRKTGVVLLQFTGGLPQPVGGALRILENKKSYAAAVHELRVLAGFTHLYEAITYATTDLLKTGVVETYARENEMPVTVVALTDGFNNLQGADLCRDNGPRLETLLSQLKSVRQSEELRKRPSVYTVGLGQLLRPLFKLPDPRSTTVSPSVLCGRYVDRRIDGDLERYGIDNASLSLIADQGGGSSYVSQDSDGLAEAFRGAAAKRYNWFELRYKVEPFHLRRKFKTGVRLVSYATAESTVEIHPSAWLDAPPGHVDAEGWAERRPMSSTLTVVMPALGLLVALSYVGAATFNTRRALFGRSRPARRKKPKGGKR